MKLELKYSKFVFMEGSMKDGIIWEVRFGQETAYQINKNDIKVKIGTWKGSGNKSNAIYLIKDFKNGN